MIYFLTTHGTLLVHRDGGLAHESLRDIKDSANLFGVDLPIEAIRHDWRDFIADHTRPPVAFTADPIEGAIGPDPTLDIVTIARDDGKILSAGREGGVTAWTDSDPAEWERFLPLSERDLGQILQLYASTWIIRSTGSLVRGWDVSLSRTFNLRVGPIEIPLNRNLPFEGRPWPFRITFLLEGWRVEELCLYRPMIFYAASTSPAVQAQLQQSVASLIQFGRYEGDVHVLTDMPHAELAATLPDLARDRLSVQSLGPQDFAGFVASKYGILDHAPAWEHQPLLYLDVDIVINAGLQPMLATIAASDRIVAPAENVGPMRTWPPVGGTLLQSDGHDSRFALGFNAGTLGIPNLPVHAGTLRLIRRTLSNILKARGRDALPWVDQEVANYVSYRLACVDTVAISRFVRYGGTHDADTPGALSGMVHFWNTGKGDRHQVMARYIEVLRAHARSGHHLS